MNIAKCITKLLLVTCVSVPAFANDKNPAPLRPSQNAATTAPPPEGKREALRRFGKRAYSFMTGGYAAPSPPETFASDHAHTPHGHTQPEPVPLDMHFPHPKEVILYDGAGHEKGRIPVKTDYDDPRVKSDDMPYNSLRKIKGPFPFEIFRHKNLTTLVLDKLLLTGPVPEEFGTLTSLKRVFLSHNELTSLPESIQNLQDLHTLYVDHNALTLLPRDLFALPLLKRLHVNNNNLQALPPCHRAGLPLEHLNASHNAITELPENMGGFQKLWSLDLSHNQLSAVNESIGDLQSVHTIDFSHNQLRALPPAIGTLNTLTILTLDNNFITHMPDTLGSLENLDILNLSRNALSAMPRALYENNNFKKLRYLNLSHNNIIDLPNQFENSLKLSGLDLSYNEIRALPGNFSEWNIEKTLDLSHNALTEIPYTALRAFQTTPQINLSHNNIRTLPENFHEFKYSNLDLSNNSIEDISLPRASRLTLFHNPLLNIRKNHKDRITLKASPRGTHVHINALALSSDGDIWDALHALTTNSVAAENDRGREVAIEVAFVMHDPEVENSFDREHEVLRLSIYLPFMQPGLPPVRSAEERRERLKKRVVVSYVSQTLEEQLGFNKNAWQEKFNSIPFKDEIPRSRMKNARSAMS